MRFQESTRCESCGALIRWAWLNGGEHPFDATPDEAGEYVVERRQGQHVAFHSPIRPQSLTLPGLELDDRERYVSHFATCPDAAEWRATA